MRKWARNKRIVYYILVTVVVLIAQGIILWQAASKKQDEKVQNAYLYGQNISDAAKLTLDNTLAASEALKYFYVTYGDACFEKFDEFAAEIFEDNPVIGSLYIAPNAVISVAYPKEVNESTIGFEMLKDPEQGPRAQLAIDTAQITVAGPHNLVEGGVGFIIRNPIFDENGFVGFTIIVLDWDRFVNQVFANSSVSSEDYKIGIWKKDYDEHAVTDEEGYIFRNTTEPVSKRVDIAFEVPNDTWHLVVEPVDGWNVMDEMGWLITCSGVVSIIFIALVLMAFRSEERKWLLQKEKLENEAKEKYMEQLSDALKAAEAANNSKTMFLNNMSHDIRTPMNAILGFARLMKKKTNEPAVIQDYVEKIEESGEYLLSIINNVLDMARIESGQIELDLNVLDVNKEISYVENLFRDELSEKNIQFSHSFSVEHPYVLADEARVTQILVNLVSNAVKYTPEGGEIRFETREISCEQEGYATYVATVSDTGIGMTKEFLGKIFDSFTREHTTTESKIIGTGLGMSIVKKLIDVMGGTIEVESEIGKGSTFRVTLSFQIMENPNASGNEGTATDKETASFQGKRILLAEDNDLNAEIAMEILKDEGIITERAADGVECVDMLMKAEDGYYDLILMDIQMPNLNGYDATRKIRSLQDAKKASIPIFAMTANAFEEDRRKAFEAGMNEHLAKPINIPELLEALAYTLNADKQSPASKS